MSLSTSTDPAPNSDRRNFWVLALHHIVIRTGWIFKTETVIIPGFLDELGVGGAVRGCLPVLGRIGQSVPQFLFANRVRRMPRQKWSLVWVSFLQGFPWMALAALVVMLPELSSVWQAAAFLIIYGVFNITFGNWVLLSGTIQGKLIALERRGRLLGVSNFWGCGLAAVAAAVWLGRWLELGLVGYGIIFGVVTASFFAAGLLALLFDEPASDQAVENVGLGSFTREAWRLIVDNANFRRLVWVVTFYYMVLILFPHYTSFASARLGIGREAFVLWVVVQNLMNAFGSAVVGPLADRRGNQTAICFLIFLAAATPLVAIALAHLPEVLAVWGAATYWIVFVLLGFTPITQRIIANYALEISPASQHPLYLGTLNLAQGLPLLLSPFAGWLIDLTSFEVVFAGGAVAILAGGMLSRRLVEPRTTEAFRQESPIP